jgi:ABC-type multidrug transport system fused ATPase/permease subunit
MLLAMVLTMAYTALALTPPLANRYFINEVLDTPKWRGWLIPVTAISLIAFLPLFLAIQGVMNRIFISALGQRLVVDLRTALYRRVLHLSMHFHGETGAGPVMNRLMTDVAMVQNMLTGETLGILSNIVALLFSLIVMFIFNWKLTLVVVVMVILYTLNYYKLAMRIRSANLELREIMDQVTGRLQERLAGVRLVKTYRRERDETDAFLASTDRALQYGMRSSMLNVSLNITASLISHLGSTVVWCGALWFVLHDQMKYGDMVAMDTYVWQAIGPAVSLTMVAGSITQALVSLDRILEILGQQPDIVDRPGAQDMPKAAGDMRLEDVGFGYVPGKPLFEHFNLHLPVGTMTALVGHTGCGKTTVTSLLMRLWDVQEGKVTLDGHDLRDLTLRSLRRHLGVVPQEPVVFESTIFDNIAYGMADATPEMVEESARAAQIHEHIAALPEGYQTWLGKEGAKLSVGEKQRIAIARAILRKPAVLILDEATSSLDSESEAAIQEAMRVVLHGRTSVVVAHRLSTIVEADQIVAMDNGRIVEMGTHDELMEIENGYYRRLYEELKGKHDTTATEDALPDDAEDAEVNA